MLTRRSRWSCNPLLLLIFSLYLLSISSQTIAQSSDWLVITLDETVTEAGMYSGFDLAGKPLLVFVDDLFEDPHGPATLVAIVDDGEQFSWVHFQTVGSTGILAGLPITSRNVQAYPSQVEAYKSRALDRPTFTLNPHDGKPKSTSTSSSDGYVQAIYVDGRCYEWDADDRKYQDNHGYHYYVFQKQENGSYTYQKKAIQIGSDKVLETGTASWQ